MKLRLTYREYSILVGIVVAAIILFILWIQPISGEASVNGGSEGSPGILPLVGSIFHKVEAAVYIVL